MLSTTEKTVYMTSEEANKDTYYLPWLSSWFLFFLLLLLASFSRSTWGCFGFLKLIFAPSRHLLLLYLYLICSSFTFTTVHLSSICCGSNHNLHTRPLWLSRLFKDIFLWRRNLKLLFQITEKALLNKAQRLTSFTLASFSGCFRWGLLLLLSILGWSLFSGLVIINVIFTQAQAQLTLACVSLWGWQPSSRMH